MKRRGIEPFVKAIRNLDSQGIPITSHALVEVMKISDTERSCAMDVAAGWISTLRRYGFLKVAKGERAPGPGRSLKVYAITDWAKRYKKGRAKLRLAANPGPESDPS